MERSIRILLVDDHSLFRESLGRLLEGEPGFRVIGSYGSSSDTLRSNKLQDADVVLLDHDLGKEQAGDFLEAARERGFEGRVIVVTAGMNQNETLLALQSGIAGIFLKHNPPSQLIIAIHQVTNGATWMDDRVIRAILDAAAAAARAEQQNSSHSLNERDQAILKALFEGLANKEIAARLNISEPSVKWALQRLFDKTGLRSRSQLVRFALENGVQDW